jgi:hypothetical protein
MLLAALVLATVVPATAAAPRTGAPPPALSAGAIRSDTPFSCEELREAPWGTLFGRACPGQQRATTELHVGWDEDDGGSFDADDAEAAWDLAFGDEREPPVEDGWRWGEE